MEKVIATRDQFVRQAEAIKNASYTGDTSVEYREASYIFISKVNKHILEPAKEIFKLPEDVKKQVESFDKERYMTGIKFAIEKPKKDGEPYEIEPTKANDWFAALGLLEKKYEEALKLRAKSEEEFKEWSKKKISLSIEKIDAKYLPSLKADEFNVISEALCNAVADDDEDGKEVE